MSSSRQEIWPLVEAGGYVYVCGEAKNMAKDVHKTLLKLAESQPGGPEEFMAALSDAGRYQKDVW
jgi:NADPH-ferrihemoprotein reductase